MYHFLETAKSAKRVGDKMNSLKNGISEEKDKIGYFDHRCIKSAGYIKKMKERNK